MNAVRLFALVAVIGIASCSHGTAQIAVERAFPALTFTKPVDIQHAGDGTNRMFVVEQAGVIRVFDNRRDVPSSKVFLDIRDRVNDSGNEEGLLGLAFHPSYEQNGWFYVNYTASNPRRTVIARFRVSPTDANTADPASEEQILTFDQPFSNHNGGQTSFGPDGYLYIATGDGGSGGDPQGNGQKLTTLLGKILRIDVNREEGGKKYAIPPDNPFAGSTAGQRPEIWAWGLRNPWRFSFDPVTGLLWTGDVGQNRLEEIDIIEGGKNYGWNIMEASSCYSPSSGCDTTGLVKPVWEYARALGVSVTGGHVYRGSSVPELVGEYIYADFGSGRMWGLRIGTDGRAVNRELIASAGNVSTFGVDERGELYYAAFDGRIYRFTPTVTSGGSEGAILPAQPRIEAGYPNPVRASAAAGVTLAVSLPRAAAVTLQLTDALGRVIRRSAEGVVAAGAHRVRVELGGLPSGVYHCALLADGMRSSIPVLVTQ